ncbi:hypothetical protein DD237_004113 [Peronospora effusa]|uniref:ER membrane protein complex subunit 2 n=1 Tax=Peronospora effusa TaxID=542832 RepID=A0A425CCH7_9STRA|nr:hypothetical protein DD237_004113 [Peronospora effusa]
METKQKIRDTKRFLLSDLLEQSYALKESLYWIALTLCGLGEYRASRSYCERLLRIEPSHMKAQLLHKRIKEVVTKVILSWLLGERETDTKHCGEQKMERLA